MQDKLNKMEPSSDVRQAANIVAQLYVALLDEGFDEIQAQDIAVRLCCFG